MQFSPQQQRRQQAFGARRAGFEAAPQDDDASMSSSGASKRQRDSSTADESFEEASSALASFESCSLNLDERSRAQLKELFSLLDRDGKRVITATDLDGCWAQVGPVLDMSGDGGIDQREFVAGIKKLALQKPFSGSRTLPQGITHGDVGALLAVSLNASVQVLSR